MTPPLRRLAATAIAIALAVTLAACGEDDDRPSAGDWQPTWVATQAEVPEPAEMDDGEDACTHALGELRASREELLPAPTPALDDRVGEWLAAAEGLMLDCPGEGDERDESFDELEVLAAEIDAALGIAAEG